MTTTPTTTFSPAVEARLDVARQVADAVLFEGYVLYPYRASAAKNRLRWQFGVLVPPSWTATAEEHDFQHTELLMEPRRGAVLAVEVRFLHAQRRTVQRALPDGGFETVPELRLEDRVVVAWDEGHEERVRLAVPVTELAGAGVEVPFTRPAGEDTEPVTEADGRVVGRLVRRRAEISGSVRLSASELDGPYATRRLSVVVENTSGWLPAERAERDAALPHSLIATHTLLCLDSGGFLSLTDPPEWAKGSAAACRNLHTWPVLAGEPGSRDLVLSSPIILEDHPAIAPESPGALYDATEIDEILALRTAALTDEEKREARGTDDRAAAVIELADSMPAEVLERLHGAVRGLREITAPGPAAPRPSAAEAVPVFREPTPAAEMGTTPGGPLTATPAGPNATAATAATADRAATAPGTFGAGAMVISRDAAPGDGDSGIGGIGGAAVPDAESDGESGAGATVTGRGSAGAAFTAGGAPGGPGAPGDADAGGFGPDGPLRPEVPWWDPGADRSVDPGTDHVLVDGRPVRAGSRVVLRPGLRRTDAQDLFLEGRRALVEAVLHDVDGGVHIAVTVDDDPGADIRREQGRYLYFQPDEVSVADAEEDV
ncbi:hypothetical protein ACWC10_32155 [Streptomyces sp. NPDC001595]|uniref:hypothetical protein n=1 Tax=Streptomyces sp. NPDC001532 TaxID=3154520 RepID=UPI00331AA6B0